MENEIYLIGSFTNPCWRQEFIDNVPNVKFDNPIHHEQSSITKLNYSDMNSASTKSSLAYVPQGKRLGTMSYAELGAARASGQTIISVDENPSESKDSILERIASHEFQSKKEAMEFLLKNSNKFKSFEPIEVIDKTKIKEEWKSLLFTGNYNLDVNQTLFKHSVLDSKKINIYDSSKFNLQNFSKDYDLLVVNFNKEDKHSPEALFLMGIAYQTKVPIILLEGHSIPYPPLLGLARRVLVGENRFEHLEEYLKNLESQHISDEALVYYNLMNKFK